MQQLLIEKSPKKQTLPLKYPGGKSWIGGILEKYYDRSQWYYAPFCGGLSDALALKPKRAFLSDINRPIVDFWEWVQTDGKLTIEMRNNQEFYYRMRSQFNGSVDPVERSQLLYYLNRTCYNGLMRFNKNGKFNVPFGQYKKINYRDNFDDVKSVIRDWIFNCADFEQVPIIHKGLVYLDPPYDSDFTAYSGRTFTWDDQVRLIEWTKRVDGAIVISNQASDRIIDLYRDNGFEISFVEIGRNINCKAEGRKAVREVIAVRK